MQDDAVTLLTKPWVLAGGFLPLPEVLPLLPAQGPAPGSCGWGAKVWMIRGAWERSSGGTREAGGVRCRGRSGDGRRRKNWGASSIQPGKNWVLGSIDRDQGNYRPQGANVRGKGDLEPVAWTVNWCRGNLQSAPADRSGPCTPSVLPPTPTLVGLNSDQIVVNTPTPSI